MLKILKNSTPVSFYEPMHKLSIGIMHIILSPFYLRNRRSEGMDGCKFEEWVHTWPRKKKLKFMLGLHPRLQHQWSLEPEFLCPRYIRKKCKYKQKPMNFFIRVVKTFVITKYFMVFTFAFEIRCAHYKTKNYECGEGNKCSKNYLVSVKEIHLKMSRGRILWSWSKYVRVK